jgi:hypothetical protein
MSKKPYEAPQIISELIMSDDSLDPEIIKNLVASGMRETKCTECGCFLITRNPIDICPPCRMLIIEASEVNKFN